MELFTLSTHIELVFGVNVPFLACVIEIQLILFTMVKMTYLGPSDDDDGQLKAYDKYAKAVRPYYVILDLFDTVHPVFNCDLARIIVSYVPDLRKAPRIYTPVANNMLEDIYVNGITRDLCIDLPAPNSSPGMGYRYNIHIGNMGTHTVYIRSTCVNISLGQYTNYQKIHTTSGNSFTSITSFLDDIWLVQGETPGNWTGTVPHIYKSTLVGA